MHHYTECITTQNASLHRTIAMLSITPLPSPPTPPFLFPSPLLPPLPRLPQEALSCYEKAAELLKENVSSELPPELLNNMAALHQKLGRFDTAKVCLSFTEHVTIVNPLLSPPLSPVPFLPSSPPSPPLSSPSSSPSPPPLPSPSPHRRCTVMPWRGARVRVCWIHHTKGRPSRLPTIRLVSWRPPTSTRRQRRSTRGFSNNTHTMSTVSAGVLP